MYGFVPYNISEIQKGIQFGHAVVEYAQKFFNTEAYQRWATKDKTFIILNGGTFNDGVEDGQEYGSMEQIYADLNSRELPLAYFREPDLNNGLSGIVLLADERVYDWKKYPLAGGITTIGQYNRLDQSEKTALASEYYERGEEHIFHLRIFLAAFQKA